MSKLPLHPLKTDPIDSLIEVIYSFLQGSWVLYSDLTSIFNRCTVVSRWSNRVPPSTGSFSHVSPFSDIPSCQRNWRTKSGRTVYRPSRPLLPGQLLIPNHLTHSVFDFSKLGLRSDSSFLLLRYSFNSLNLFSFFSSLTNTDDVNDRHIRTQTVNCRENFQCVRYTLIRSQDRRRETVLFIR